LPWTSTPNRDTLELVPIGHLLPVELPPDIVMSGREMAFHGITGKEWYGRSGPAVRLV